MAGITEAGYIKDRDCTMDTPIFYGRPEIRRTRFL